MSVAAYPAIQELSADDYQKATIEVAFLLDAFASTIDNIMGGNTTPVGRIAGRDTARKLPIELQDPSYPEIVSVLADQMQAGFGIALEGDQLVFRRCVIREMCALRNIPIGGALCKLFHSYFDGIINGLLFRPVKSSVTVVGEECRLVTAVQ